MACVGPCAPFSRLGQTRMIHVLLRMWFPELSRHSGPSRACATGFVSLTSWVSAFVRTQTPCSGHSGQPSLRHPTCSHLSRAHLSFETSSGPSSQFPLCGSLVPILCPTHLTHLVPPGAVCPAPFHDIQLPCIWPLFLKTGHCQPPRAYGENRFAVRTFAPFLPPTRERAWYPR